MKIGQLAASTTTTIKLTWLPAVIHFVSTANPTAAKVDVLGRGITCNLNTKGIAIVSAIWGQGIITNGYSIPLADGIVTGKNVEITITNAQAGTVDVYGYSTQQGATYVESMVQKVFADSGVVLSDFFQLCLPSMVAADELTISYKDGFNQKMTIEDLRRDVAYSGIVSNSVNDIRILNHKKNIKSISFIPNAEQDVYLFRYGPIG